MSIVKFSNHRYKSQFTQQKGFILLELGIAIFLLTCFSMLITVHYSTMIEKQISVHQQLLINLRIQSIIAQLRTGQQVANPTYYPDNTKINYTISQQYKHIPYYSIIVEACLNKTAKKIVFKTGMLL